MTLSTLKGEPPLDPPESNDITIEAAAAEVAKELIEHGSALVRKERTVDMYTIAEDVALKVYEDCGKGITEWLALSVFASDHGAQMPAEVDKAVRETLRLTGEILQSIAVKRFNELCEKIAKERLEHERR